MKTKSRARSRRLRNGSLYSVARYVYFTLGRFYQDGLFQSVGALTYSTLLAFVPFLVIAFSIFSAFPAFDAVQERLKAILFANILPEAGEELLTQFRSFTSNASDLTAVGVVALVVSAILLLFTIEATLNRVWHVRRERPLLSRLLVFWTLLTLGPLLLGASFAASSDALVWLQDRTGAGSGGLLPPWLRMPFATVIQAIVFTAFFKLVPASTVRWGDAAVGGAIGAVGFQLLTWVFGVVMGSGSTYSTIYGAVAAVPIFLVWTYACWTVIIVGAVFAASLPDWRLNREIIPVEHLSPQKRLASAVAVLSLLARNAREGGGTVEHEHVADVIPLGARHSMIERLHSHGYLVETSQDGIALARDLEQTTLADLARDIGVALGTGPDAPDAKSALDQLLARLGEAEGDILGRPLSEIIGGEPDRRGGTDSADGRARNTH